MDSFHQNSSMAEKGSRDWGEGAGLASPRRGGLGKVWFLSLLLRFEEQMHLFCDRWGEQVIEEKKWREAMATAFKFPPTNTSASFVLRRYYLSLPYVPPVGALLAHAAGSDQCRCSLPAKWPPTPPPPPRGRRDVAKGPRMSRGRHYRCNLSFSVHDRIRLIHELVARLQRGLPASRSRYRSTASSSSATW